MAPSAVTAIAIILTNVLKLAGIDVGTEELTNTIVTLVTIIGGLIVLGRQVWTGRSKWYGARAGR